MLRERLTNRSNVQIQYLVLVLGDGFKSIFLDCLIPVTALRLLYAPLTHRARPHLDPQPPAHTAVVWCCMCMPVACAETRGRAAAESKTKRKG